MTKIDSSLFQHQGHSNLDPCPLCSSDLQIKYGKSGAFIGCTSYPSCDYTKPINDTEVSSLKVIDNADCPSCGSALEIKKGRYGLFIGCSNFPDCRYMTTLKQKTETELSCPSCGEGQLVKRVSRFGKAFYACNAYPKCRYAVNYPPVAKRCPACGFPIMVEKSTSAGKRLQCPQKSCQHKL